MKREIAAYWLGRVAYEEAHALQQRLVSARVRGEIGDVVLLLEHEKVITLGRGAKEDNILSRPADVDIVETGRGGDVTFHGPGQLVAYPIVDLKPDRQDVRRYVRDLAEVMIRLAKDHGVAAGVVPSDPKLVGVWIDEESPRTWDADLAAQGRMNLAKIGAIGVRLSRWVTMHGFAFNVATDLSGFSLIVPCGIRGHGVASLATAGVSPVPSVEDVARASLRHFAEVFDAAVEQRSCDELLRGVDPASDAARASAV